MSKSESHIAIIDITDFSHENETFTHEISCENSPIL